MSGKSRRHGVEVVAVVAALAMLGSLGVLLVVSGGSPARELAAPAGLAPAANTSNSFEPVTFLADMYADGAHGSFDAVGDHPYTFPATPDSDPQGAWGEMDQTSPSLRSLMVQYGDSDKDIWITEFGAPTGTVTEAQQSTELVQAITEAKQTSWIGAFYIYTWSDQFGGAGFGLLDSNGNPKPAYSAVAALTTP